MTIHQNHIRTRLQFLWDTLPDASRRRTARGRMRTCRQLSDHRRRAEQLGAYVTCDADRKLIDELIAEINGRPDALVADGRIRNEVRVEAAGRRARRQADKLAQLEAFAKLIGLPPLPPSRSSMMLKDETTQCDKTA